jgi:Ca-activated chloride channel family protein
MNRKIVAIILIFSSLILFVTGISLLVSAPSVKGVSLYNNEKFVEAADELTICGSDNEYSSAVKQFMYGNAMLDYVVKKFVELQKDPEKAKQDELGEKIYVKLTSALLAYREAVDFASKQDDDSMYKDIAVNAERAVILLSLLDKQQKQQQQNGQQQNDQQQNDQQQNDQQQNGQQQNGQQQNGQQQNGQQQNGQQQNGQQQNGQQQNGQQQNGQQQNGQQQNGQQQNGQQQNGQQQNGQQQNGQQQNGQQQNGQQQNGQQQNGQQQNGQQQDGQEEKEGGLTEQEGKSEAEKEAERILEQEKKSLDDRELYYYRKGGGNNVEKNW